MSSFMMSVRNFPQRYEKMLGDWGAGILLTTGGIVRRYATMALRSLSESSAIDGHGIGYGIMRVLFRRIPFVRSVLISSSVQFPSPVSLSEVRLYETWLSNG